MATIQQTINETIFFGLVEFDKYCEKLLPYGVEIGAVIFCLGAAIYFLFIKKTPKPVLHPTEWKDFKLIGKRQLSHNTARYRFGLPKKDDILGLPIGQHISLGAEIDGKFVQRSYTPVTLDAEKGYFDLVVKTYEKGNISRVLAGLKIGDTMKVRGPKGKFEYSNTLSPHLLMIAGGTGLTPMYQIIKASVQDSMDRTELRLIYANVEEEDILLREELEHLVKRSHGRFKIYYVLNKAPEGWTGGEGFVTQKMIEEHAHEAGINAGGKVLICGPPPMVTAMKAHLTAIGYPAARAMSKLEDQVFLF